MVAPSDGSGRNAKARRQSGHPRISATTASAMPRRSSRESPMTSAITETITAARPKYAAHGIKVSNEKRKCHHPARQPIGPSASSTTAVPANANASSGTWCSRDRRAVDEFVAMVIVCSSQSNAMTRSNRTPHNPPLSSTFRVTRPRQTRTITAVREPISHMSCRPEPCTTANGRGPPGRPRI